MLSWTAPFCPLSLDFLRRESVLLDGRMDAKIGGEGWGEGEFLARGPSRKPLIRPTGDLLSEGEKGLRSRSKH